MVTLFTVEQSLVLHEVRPTLIQYELKRVCSWLVSKKQILSKSASRLNLNVASNGDHLVYSPRNKKNSFIQPLCNYQIEKKSTKLK